MSKVKSFARFKYDMGAGSWAANGFRNGSSASTVTMHGEMLVQKFFARNGPSGWYSHACISRALESLIKTRPTISSTSRSIGTVSPNEFHEPIRIAISSSESHLVLGAKLGYYTV